MYNLGLIQRKILIESELLFQLYYGNDYSTDEIAKLFNTCPGTIKKLMNKFNIPRRTRSDAMKNRPKEMNERISKKLVGRHSSPNTEFKKGEHCGKDHPNWQGGKSFEEYGKDFNRKLKEKIRKRDNYICRECGYSQKLLDYKLHIHHIDYDKKNNSEDNLISLCKSCHCQTNFDRVDWTKYFKENMFKI
jgi:hypothetical protein